LDRISVVTIAGTSRGWITISVDSKAIAILSLRNLDITDGHAG
jgi:hypothetical protein